MTGYITPKLGILSTTGHGSAVSTLPPWDYVVMGTALVIWE